MQRVQPDGFLALPQKGTGSPVLVLHAWWGLNETTKAICRRLAENGFVAFAPDLYGGKVVDTIADAEKRSRDLDANQARAEINAAVQYLIQQSGQTERGIAVIGLSLGAFFALELSCTHPELIRSVVVFYGTNPADYTGAVASYLGHFAEIDEFEPQSEVDNLAASLGQAGRPVEFHLYPGTGHWFFEPDCPDAYSETAAALAWKRTISFLDRQFGSLHE